MSTANPDDPSFSFEDNPDLWLFTSLTSGSSQIITATSRMETILKANRVPFKAIDTATNEKARKIWGRRSQGKRLPGLVKEGWVLCDLPLLEEWNEYGETKENLGAATPMAAAVPPSQKPPPEVIHVSDDGPVKPTVVKTAVDEGAQTSTDASRNTMNAQLASEAAAAAMAKKAASTKSSTAEPTEEAESKDKVEDETRDETKAEGKDETKDETPAAEEPSESTMVNEPEQLEENKDAVAPLDIPGRKDDDPPRKDSYVKGEPGKHASFDMRPSSSDPQRSRASSRANQSAAASPPTGTGSASLAFPVLKRSEKSLDSTPTAPAELTKALNAATAPSEEGNDIKIADDGAQPAAKSGLEAVTADSEALKAEEAEAEKQKEQAVRVGDAEEGMAPPPKLDNETDQIDPPLTSQTNTNENLKAASLADVPEAAEETNRESTKQTTEKTTEETTEETTEDVKTTVTDETATDEPDQPSKESVTAPTASEEVKQEEAAQTEVKEPEDASKSVGD